MSNNFISKLIYWFNLLIIYFLHQGASLVSYWKKIVKIGNLRSLLRLAKNYCQFSIGDAFALNSSN